jgi:hypothetical protein
MHEKGKMFAVAHGGSCLVEDAKGNVLLNKLVLMGVPQGRFVPREGTLSAEPDGSYILGESRPDGHLPWPVSVRLERAGQGTQPASAPAAAPAITHLVVDHRKAAIEGWASEDSTFVIQVGTGYHTNGFINDSAFTAVIERPWLGQGFNCTVKDSLGKTLLTLGNAGVGPMTRMPGRLVFREGEPKADANGSYVIGEFVPDNGPAAPISVRLNPKGRRSALLQWKLRELGVGLDKLINGPAISQRSAFGPAGQASRLQFRLVADANDPAPADTLDDPDSNGKATVRVRKEVLLDESAVTGASVTILPDNKATVTVNFNEAGANRFADITGANIGKRLAVVYDGKVLSAPMIRSVIRDKAIITGNYTAAEVAQRVAQALNQTKP